MKRVSKRTVNLDNEDETSDAGYADCVTVQPATDGLLTTLQTNTHTSSYSTSHDS